MKESIAVSSTWKAPARRLMAAAEELFGIKGFESVSLVEIARHAGQSNKYAVQYHFGSKEDLVRAIFDCRLQSISQRRMVLLDALNTCESVSVRKLLEAFIYPVYEEVDENGFHPYVRFAERMLETADGERIWCSSAHFKTTSEIFRRIRSVCQDMSDEMFDARVRLVCEMLIRTLLLIDQHKKKMSNTAPSENEHLLLNTSIDLACLAFSSASATGRNIATGA
ncbi:TetR/AcrR family transcriptional regulator [Pseudomonas sp. NBRC 100443]|uniref:TetR/AcrR family transcriptional regulator n=1 Tax=Pseudomonas sp. NBRC 100443 TaxID=1113665 RepID=UPI0024A19D9B|nr:TetR/AcrR family transcriptional regulator [Pseudomonas sp. NBRC 100443]GLU37324.1 hypothetical protein Pssp01_14170 [Pseudomonas sp. NBRC 100443]